MPVLATAPNPVANRLLAALPAVDFARLRPMLEPVALIFKDKYGEPGKPEDYVYFPFHGIMSLLVTTSGGESIEVAFVGNEGLVGIYAYPGTNLSPFRVICQVPGDGVRIKIKTFQKEMERGGVLAAVFGRFLEELLIQIAVSGACNRLHTVMQRCARWLLMTYDRVDGTEFPLTQEFLSAMLGVRRAGVSAVATAFKRYGIIRYSRGKVVILDRAVLETMACECYQTIQRAYARISAASNGMMKKT